MRIAYLASSRIPSRAANTVQTMKMCDAFTANGHSVTLYSQRSTDAPGASVFEFYGVESRFQHIPLEPRGPAGTRTLIRVARTASRVRRLRPDLLFARDLYGLAASAITGIPMVLEVHREMQDGAESAVFEWLVQRSAFRRLVVVSEAMGERFVNRFPILATKDVLVAPGAAEPPVTALPHRPWPGRQGALQLGYVGHLYDGRGVDVLIEMARTLPQVDLHFVGGHDRDVQRWSDASAGVPNIFFHGFVPHSQLSAFYEHFEVLLAPYQREVYAAGGVETSAVMSPLKLFEYMSRGVPMVASDLPAIRAVLSDGHTAVLVDPADPGEWARSVSELLEDPGRRSRIGQEAYRRFEAKHTWRGRAVTVLAGIDNLRKK